MDSESITMLSGTVDCRRIGSKYSLENEEACVNKRKPLRINGEKHDEMLLPITPLSV
jgi:hypothetical protein